MKCNSTPGSLPPSPCSFVPILLVSTTRQSFQHLQSAGSPPGLWVGTEAKGRGCPTWRGGPGVGQQPQEVQQLQQRRSRSGVLLRTHPSPTL